MLGSSQVQNQISKNKAFKISIQALQHQFTCTVCLNPIEDCYVTRCGHVYCKVCIQQTVNRHHRCPFCNQQLKQFKEDVFKNYHFNTIKKIMQDEKLKQSQKYLKKVFASDSISQIQKQNQQISKLLKPIEERIVRFCQSALLEYRKFVIGLYDIQKKVEQRKALFGSQNFRQHSFIISQLQQVILKTLKNPIISPQIMQLSTQIQLMIPGNKIIKQNIKLSPLASYQVLIPYIQNICSENNIRVQGKISQQLLINANKYQISDRLGLNAGKKLKIEGGIPFESKVFCFSYNWFKQKKSDFMMCKQCKLKWICENCALHCHEGHSLAPQLKQHKPDWAICYCATKYDCKAINKNSMIE